jgi:hypothetical protein
LDPLPSVWEPILYGYANQSQAVTDAFDSLDQTGSAVLYETDWSDNLWREAIPVRPPINLAFDILDAPDAIPAPQPPAQPSYQVTAAITNDSTQPVNTILRLEVYSTAVQGGLIETPVTLPPGTSYHHVTVPGSSAGDTIRVVGTLNPDRSVPETDYSDNHASAITQVENVDSTTPTDYGKVDDILLH